MVVSRWLVPLLSIYAYQGTLSKAEAFFFFFFSEQMVTGRLTTTLKWTERWFGSKNETDGRFGYLMQNMLAYLFFHPIILFLCRRSTAPYECDNDSMPPPSSFMYREICSLPTPNMLPAATTTRNETVNTKTRDCRQR